LRSPEAAMLSRLSQVERRPEGVLPQDTALSSQPGITSFTRQVPIKHPVRGTPLAGHGLARSW
jgi:hypothetical protein